MLPLPMNKNVRQRLRRVASRQNPLVKDLRRAFARSETTPDGSCAIESVRLVEEAIRSGLKFRAVFFRQSSLAVADRLLPQIAAQVETVLLPNEIFDSAVATETPQGVAALVHPRVSRLDELFSPAAPLILGCAGLQDPGNFGTILRSAEAFGASGLIATEGTVSTANPKVARASAGSLFRLPVIRLTTVEALAALEEHGVQLAVTSSHATLKQAGSKLHARPVQEVDLTQPIAIFIGSEGQGVPRAFLDAADEAILIPHSPKVESLNAAIAASILLYEAQRQRSR